MPRQEVLVCDLDDSDPKLIQKYIDYHRPGNVPKEILRSIVYPGSGVQNMRIYNFANRLVMIMDVDDVFSFDTKAQSDSGNPAVQEWEKLMSTFQRPVREVHVTGTGQEKDDAKWKRADKCFDLSEHQI